MQQLDEWTGRLNPTEFSEAACFATACDALKKGTNDRRVVTGGNVWLSQVRAKAAEVFVGRLLGVPVDLTVYISGNDSGIDTIYRGHGVQIKRAGTRKTKRGKPWFKLELNDPAVNSPPWDLGLLVEDDPEDSLVFRLAGWITRDQWIEEKEFLSWRPASCWTVKRLRPPNELQKIPWRQPLHTFDIAAAYDTSPPGVIRIPFRQRP
jgi:hypothetical protein